MDVKISQVQKLKHEKDLIQTFEEAYLFPVNIAGKKYYLHGNGQESIKHGEAFRAIINGQSIKLWIWTNAFVCDKTNTATVSI